MPKWETNLTKIERTNFVYQKIISEVKWTRQQSKHVIILVP